LEVALLTRSHKVFAKVSTYVALTGFLLGFWLWLSAVRLVVVESQSSKNKSALLLLKEPTVGDRAVFTYPDLQSPLVVALVESHPKNGHFIVKIEDEPKEVSEDLFLGVVIYSF
jgi:hypothetical protein